MSNTFKVITQPTAAQEPFTVQQVKDHLRVEHNTEDDFLRRQITRARSYGETITHRSLATQVIRQLERIDRPIGGDLSGPIDPGPSWYQFNQELGANPFGPTQWYMDLVMPPIQANQTITIQTKVTAFDDWVTFPQTDPQTGKSTIFVDDTSEPGRIYFLNPITANFYQITFTAGYNTAYPIPADIASALMDLVSHYYDNRDGEDIPASITNRLLSRRVDWM